MRCEDCREMMVEALYGELAGARGAEFEAHIGECEACRTMLGEMRGTLGWMDKRERRDPGAAYWEGYWNRLTARMEKEGVELGRSPTPWWRRNVLGADRPAAAWVYRAVAAATILVLGVFVGRSFFPQVRMVGEDTPPRVATPAEEAPLAGGVTQPASANERAMRYIAKSQLLLIALVNNDPGAPDTYASNIGAQRRRSAELAEEAPAIKAGLTDPKQRRLRELVDDLEKILIQIANLESDEDVEGVEFIRSRVNDHDVLFKIDLEQMRQGDEDEGNKRSI